MVAELHDDPYMMELLLAHHAQVNAMDSNGRTALHDAQYRDKPALVSLLIAAGADPGLKDHAGWVAEHYREHHEDWADVNKPPGVTMKRVPERLDDTYLTEIHATGKSLSTPGAAYADFPELNACKPGYPVAAVRAEEEGSVEAQFDVDERGVVSNATILASSGYRNLDRASLAWLAQCRFKGKGHAGKKSVRSFKAMLNWQGTHNSFDEQARNCVDRLQNYYPGAHADMHLPGHPEATLESLLYYSSGDTQTYLRVNFANAELVCKRMLSNVEADLGSNHPLVVAALNNLAALYIRNNMPDQAELLFKRVVEINANFFGMDSGPAAKAWESLADFLEKNGARERAKDARQHANAIRTTPARMAGDYVAIVAAGDCALGLRLDHSIWSWRDESELFGQPDGYRKSSRSQPQQVGQNYLAVTAAGGNQVGQRWPRGEDFKLEARRSDGLIQTLRHQCSHLSADRDETSTDFQRVVAALPESENGVRLVVKYGLKDDGSLWIWGTRGEGNPTTGTKTTRMLPLQIGEAFQDVSSVQKKTLALKHDGTLWSWEIHDYHAAFAPVPVKIGEAYSSMAMTSTHSFAIKTDGSLWAWGINNDGQLGDGTQTTRDAAVQIGTGYRQVAAWNNLALALKADGSVWAWGHGASDQYAALNSGNAQRATKPAQIASGFSAIAAGTDFGLGLKPDGSLWVWDAYWR